MYKIIGAISLKIYCESILIACFLAFAGCQQSNVTPTKGAVVVDVDRAVFPVIKKEKNVFDSLYVQAKLTIKEVDPLQGIIDLLNGKVKMVVSTQYFNRKESHFIDSLNLDIKRFKFCYNAIAIIGSKKNTTENIRVDEIKDALLGNSSNYNFIIPGNTTSTYSYIKDELLNGQDPKNAQIVKNDSEVVSKVEKFNDVLGIVSFNQVQDSSLIHFVQVGQLKNQSKQASNAGLNVSYFTPHPGFVLKEYYPLKQTVYIFLHEYGMSPASGFTTFLTSYEGQKIALSQNLAPAAVPVKINESQ